MKNLHFITGQKLAFSTSVIAAFWRILPHPANFTPVGGLSLYAGARMKGPAAWILPLILMVTTDIALGFIHGYGPFSAVTPFVYGAILLNVFIGTFLRTTENPVYIGAAALIGSLLFFLITNTGSWLVSGMYDLTPDGLITALAAGIPFYQYTLAGDLIFTGILFTAHSLITRRWFTEERVAAADQT